MPAIGSMASVEFVVRDGAADFAPAWVMSTTGATADCEAGGDVAAAAGAAGAGGGGAATARRVTSVRAVVETVLVRGAAGLAVRTAWVLVVVLVVVAVAGAASGAVAAGLVEGSAGVVSVTGGGAVVAG